MKRVATLLSAFLSNLPNDEPKDPPDWIIWDNLALLSFISVNIFLGKKFLILVVCRVVRNNSWGNSSSWKFFLVILNVAPVLFFVADFNLFSCIFISLTLDSS